MKVLSFFNSLILILALFTVATLAQNTGTFENTTRIVIRDNNTADPYPSIVTVAGLAGTISTAPGSVRVRLNNFNHTFPGDVGIVLVGPTGAAFLIQSGSSDVAAVNVTYTISDTGTERLPTTPALVNGMVYRPTAYFIGDVFDAPGPGTNYQTPEPAGAQSPSGVNATFSSVFGGTAPNGQWRLFVKDFEGGDFGEITNGWTLSLTTVGGATPTPTPATPTPTPTPTPATPTPTPTPATPTPTPTPATPTPTPTPATPTPTPTPATPTPTPVTPTPTPTPTPGTPTPTPTNNVSFVGVNTANQLVGFNFANSNFGTFPSTITGLQAGENILGIDFRPATGQLFALGSSSRLYTINLTTGAATQVGTAGAFTLNGTNFGFDFNPSVDLIRVISDTGQNIRLNPNTGALAGTDTVLNPATTGATASAYTNNFAGTTTTTLYDIDTTSDTLFIQGGLNGTPSPNGGTLTAVGTLGVDASAVNGFDIGTNGVAYAALTVGGVTSIYTINLQNGKAMIFLPTNSATSLRGLAVAPGSVASGTGRGTSLDFDGDRRADYAVFRPSNTTFFVRRSSNNSFFGVQFGLVDDIATPGDYDGDGRADIAVFRPSNGTFYLLRSSDNLFQAVQFGQNGDEPVARDYSGDGRTDFAVVRRVPGTGGANGQLIWYILTSNNFAFSGTQFGLDTDVVAPGDYDGDGRFDLAVYRGSGADRTGQATFFVQRSREGFQAVQFGLGSDSVVPGDYDGDGRTDFAVVRKGVNYTWYILNSSNFSFRAVVFGTKPDLPTQADYDGDGRTDISVFRQQTGTFFTLRSGSNNAFEQVQFGQNGDYPIANFDEH